MKKYKKIIISLFLVGVSLVSLVPIINASKKIVIF